MLAEQQAQENSQLWTYFRPLSPSNYSNSDTVQNQLKQDNNNKSNICAVIPYDRSKSVKATVGVPVLLRQHAVHLGNRVQTQYDSVNCLNALFVKENLSEKHPPPTTVNHTFFSELH